MTDLRHTLIVCNKAAVFRGWAVLKVRPLCRAEPTDRRFVKSDGRAFHKDTRRIERVLNFHDLTHTHTHAITEPCRDLCWQAESRTIDTLGHISPRQTGRGDKIDDPSDPGSRSHTAAAEH